MQQKRILSKRLYHINKIDETEYSKESYERKEMLEKIELLLRKGYSEKVALSTIELSRSTYYRWKKNYMLFGLAGLENESKRPVKLLSLK